MCDMNKRAKAFAKQMYAAYEKEQQEGCGKLMLDWIAEHFWGTVAQQHISVFNELWSKLHGASHVNRKKGYVYGDMDGVVWCEMFKDKKIIIHISFVTCNPADTTIYILDDGVKNWTQFEVYEVWPRQKQSNRFAGSWKWGDHRDINVPSLRTFRDYGFEYGYQDARDKCYVMKYEALFGKVDGAIYTQNRISRVLERLRDFNSDEDIGE